MEKTRAQVRREVATVFGDAKQVYQTVTPGSVSTFTDNRRLNDEDTYYAGADIIMVGGGDDNLNETRYILSSERSTATLTVTPDWNAVPALGDAAEIYNLQGMVATVQEWNAFINQAQSEAAVLRASVPITVSLGTFTADSWTDSDWEYLSDRQQSVVIPAGIDMASVVTYVRDGRTYYPDRAGLYSGEGWRIDDITRRVIIEGNLIDDADGSTVYLRGFGSPQELATDQDTTGVPVAWLYAKVKALAYARVSEKGLFDMRGESTKWEGIAKDAQRLLSVGTYPPNTVRLW